MATEEQTELPVGRPDRAQRLSTEAVELLVNGARAAVDNDDPAAVRNQRDAVAAMLGDCLNHMSADPIAQKVQEAGCVMLNSVFGLAKWPTFKDGDLKQRLNERRESAGKVG